MAVPFGGAGFRRVIDVITTACQRGCEMKYSTRSMVTPWGTKRIRYLYNDGVGWFDMTDYDDDEFMAPSCIENAERRLQISLAP